MNILQILVKFNEFIMNNLILIMDTKTKIYKIFVKLSFPYELLLLFTNFVKC